MNMRRQSVDQCSHLSAKGQTYEFHRRLEPDFEATFTTPQAPSALPDESVPQVKKSSIDSFKAIMVGAI